MFQSLLQTVVEGNFVAIAASLSGLSFVSSLLLAEAMRRVAPRLGLMDCPDGRRKLHNRSTPLMGGVAIYGSLFLTLFAARFCISRNVLPLLPDDRTLFGLGISAGLFFALGLYDDKWPIRARAKLLGQVVACVPFVMVAPLLESCTLLGFELDVGIYGRVLTLLWLVICVNVVNLLDGLDGLATTIGLTATITVTVLCLIGGNYGLALCAIICAASFGGFLPHNWPPAKIFLGDSGSLTIGFLAGALSLLGAYKSATGAILIIPIACMSIPLFDTVLAIIRRKLTGRSLGYADRGHIHHRLQERGMTPRQILVAIGLLSCIMAFGTIASVYFSNDWIAAVTCIATLTCVTYFGYFGNHEIHLIRKFCQVACNVFRDANAELRFQMRSNDCDTNDLSDWQEWWDHSCRCMSTIGGSSLTVYRSQSGNQRNTTIAEWKCESYVLQGSMSEKIQYTHRLNRDLAVTLVAEGPQLIGLAKRTSLLETFELICRRCSVDPQTDSESILHLPTRDAA